MYLADMLLAGWDKKEGSSLYYLDYLGALIKVPFGCHGYGSVFALSILDRFYRSDMPINDAVELLTLIMKELKKRFLINIPRLFVRSIGKEGTFIFCYSL
ncbi:hypothetical protein MXB_1822 [Myxobolus squamalis]|nr:hypothetical protein MXB_1822 [Myxobolus squamalis]